MLVDGAIIGTAKAAVEGVDLTAVRFAPCRRVTSWARISDFCPA